MATPLALTSSAAMIVTIKTALPSYAPGEVA
jgi:hypothetical protein